MKKFYVYIVGGLLVLLCSMTVLDIVYTRIYETAPPRTKFQYLRSLKNTEIDYIFLGSSRVENGIVPSLIDEMTHKKAINLGFQASKLVDIYTVLQLIEAYNIHYDKIFIQVDYIYNFVGGNSNIFQFEMIPFVRDNKITKDYSDQFSEHPLATYYIPFFRYCDNDLKMGFREFFANMVNKKTTISIEKGYSPKYGNEGNLSAALPSTVLTSNPVLDSIMSFSKKNKMNVVFYCAPFCKNNQNQNFTIKLKEKIPGFLDFSRVIQEDALFLNCNHLNDTGARWFTKYFTEQVLLKNNK